jgi:superfamily II DNA or RNA helicase
VFSFLPTNEPTIRHPLAEIAACAAECGVKTKLQGRGPCFGFPLRDYQRSAIKAVEGALWAERRAMLLAMATGTGKTKLAIALLYSFKTTSSARS